MADKGKTDTAKFINLQDKINKDIEKIKANLKSFRDTKATNEKEEEKNEVFKKNKYRFATLKDHLRKIKNNYINYLTRKQIGTTLGLFIAEELKEKEKQRLAEEKRLADEAEKQRLAEEKRLADIAKKRRLEEFDEMIDLINKIFEEINTLSNGLNKNEQKVKDFLKEYEYVVERRKIQEAKFKEEIENFNFDCNSYDEFKNTNSVCLIDGLLKIYEDSGIFLVVLFHFFLPLPYVFFLLLSFFSFLH